MTSFVAWTGIDSRRPASLYFASDSRITWDQGRRGLWDSGRKLFASRAGPHLFGYVGDVLFPALFLSQAIELVDEGLLFSREDSHAERVDALKLLASSAFTAYPGEHRQPLSLVYGDRDEGAPKNNVFNVSVLDWDRSSGWSSRRVAFPSKSAPVVVLGSGGASVNRWYARWEMAQKERTSRAVYSAFCDSLRSHEDPQTGGAPQLARLYRRGNAEIVGTLYSGYAYRLGLPAGTLIAPAMEWRNELFERCDQSGLLLLGAQRHARAPSVTTKHKPG